MQTLHKICILHNIPAICMLFTNINNNFLPIVLNISYPANDTKVRGQNMRKLCKLHALRMKNSSTFQLNSASSAASRIVFQDVNFFQFEKLWNNCYSCEDQQNIWRESKHAENICKVFAYAHFACCEKKVLRPLQTRIYVNTHTYTPQTYSHTHANIHTHTHGFFRFPRINLYSMAGS